MTLAHEGSRLALKNKVPALPEGMILFPLAGGVENTTADIPIISEQGLTFREDEKRFMGSVAVESGTTNRINPTAFWNLRSGLINDWSLEQLDNGSVIKITALKNNPEVAQWNDIASNNTSYSVTANITVTYSCEIISRSTDNIFVASGGFGNIETQKRYGNRVGRTITHTSNWTHNFTIRTKNISAIKQGDFLIVRNFQIEAHDHITSFTPNSRPVGNLSYDISHLGMRDAGCISCWIYNSDAMVNNRATNNQVNNQYLLKMGSDIIDAHADAMALWIPNSIPRRFKFWTSADKNTNHLASLQDVGDYGVGSWNHFVIQWDKNGLPSGATKEFYINGVRQQSNNTTSLPSKTLTYFLPGQWSPNGSLIPSTLFEQLAVHPSKGFSAEEIRNWYNANAPFYDFRDTRIRW